MAVWKDVSLFPTRFANIEKAVERYLERDYISSIHVVVPQFEGIVRDYLASQDVSFKPNLQSCFAKLRALVLSRRLMLFPSPVLDLILDFLEKGSFVTSAERIHDPAAEVNRHGVAHGVFSGFENRDIALKYLALLDGLAFLLQHDRIVSGAL